MTDYLSKAGELEVLIDRVDEALVRLLQERAGYAREFGEYKRRLNISIERPRREAQVISHVRALSVNGVLGPDAVEGLFKKIIEEMKNLQR